MIPASHDLTIKAGEAFGSGAHPSTQGALHLLHSLCREDPPPRNILDMGCGSGILGIAAACWQPAATVLAVDVHPAAIPATLENAGLNGVSGRIAALQSDGFSHPNIAARAPYDLIICNLLAETLMAMAGDLRTHLAPGGYAVLSGILAWLQPGVCDACTLAGLQLSHTHAIGEWRTCLVTREA